MSVKIPAAIAPFGPSYEGESDWVPGSKAGGPHTAESKIWALSYLFSVPELPLESQARTKDWKPDWAQGKPDQLMGRASDYTGPLEGLMTRLRDPLINQVYGCEYRPTGEKLYGLNLSAYVCTKEGYENALDLQSSSLRLLDEGVQASRRRMIQCVGQHLYTIEPELTLLMNPQLIYCELTSAYPEANVLLRTTFSAKDLEHWPAIEAALLRTFKSLTTSN